MKTLFIGVLFLVFMTKGCASSSDVTLKAALGNIDVQMFSTLYGNNPGVNLFRDGTHCKKLDGPIEAADDGGPPMEFYKLDCNGVTGYVNVQWVQD